MRKRSLLIPLIAVFGLGSAATAITLTHSVVATQTKAEEGTFAPAGTLPGTYKINDRFYTPGGNIEYKGERLPIEDSYLVYPDGKTYKKDSYSLNIAGRYDCTFVAKKGGKTVYAHYIFSAYSGAYTINNAESSVVYEEQLPTTNEAVGGLTVTLAENDMFTFNQPIDLSDCDLNKPIIKYFPHAMSLRANPANAGLDMSKTFEHDDPNKPTPNGIDCASSVVRFTDAYDPTNYIETYMFYRTANMANNRQQQYAVGGSSNQNKIGLEVNTSGRVGSGSRIAKIDGVDYTVYIGNRNFGATMDTRSGYITEKRPNPSTGKVENRCIGTTTDPNTTADISNADDYGYSVYFDSDTNKLYLQHVTRHFLNDLDEPALYTKDEQFKGFTTGEVYVSLYGLEYNDATAKFSIQSIYGISGEDLNAASAVDNRKPEIKLSSDKDDFNISVNERFDVFEAEVTDVNYVGDLDISVYYERGKAQETQVSLIDGGFTPTKPGEYTVVYSAKDTYGNVGVRTLTLHAINTPHDQIVDFTVARADDAEAGSTIVLPEHSVTSYNDSLDIECYAIYEDGTKTNVNLATREVFLSRVGEYTIVYQYGDGLFSYEYSYKLNSLPSNRFYLEKISLPKYLIKGAEYTLDKASVVQCDSKDLRFLDPEVYAIEDGNSKLIDPKDYMVEASSTVKLVYKHGDQTVFESDEIKVVDPSFQTELIRSDYFVDYGIRAEANSSAIVLSASEGEEAHTDFANVLNFMDFSLDFDFAAGSINASSFDVVLTDFEDENNTLKISFFTEYGVRKVNIGGLATFSCPDNYSIAYNNLSGYIYDSSDSKAYLDNPFPSGRVYLSFYFREVTGTSAVGLKAIGDQRLSDSTYDDCRPNIIPQRIDGRHEFGETITVDFVYPDDVFSPYLEKNYELSVIYYASSEDEPTYVTSIDGTALDGSENVHASYSFKVDQLGSYEVIYSYTDQAYVQGSLDYAFTATDNRIIDVADDLPPTITLNGGYDGSTVVVAATGSEYKVQGYKVSDNISGVTVKIYAISPSLVRTLVTNNKVTLTEAGLWSICYFATDESGNSTSITYRVMAI